MACCRGHWATTSSSMSSRWAASSHVTSPATVISCGLPSRLTGQCCACTDPPRGGGSDCVLIFRGRAGSSSVQRWGEVETATHCETGRTPRIRPINSVIHKGKPSVGISPGARAASPPLRGLSLAEDPFTRAVERASPCAGHARWEPPDHGAVMHGTAMLRRGTTNDAAGRRWHNESMSSHGPTGRHHTRQHRGSRHDQLADDLQEFS